MIGNLAGTDGAVSQGATGEKRIDSVEVDEIIRK
jgi:hypothetical protein